jgi:hypothetical protein
VGFEQSAFAQSASPALPWSLAGVAWELAKAVYRPRFTCRRCMYASHDWMTSFSPNARQLQALVKWRPSAVAECNYLP